MRKHKTNKPGVYTKRHCFKTKASAGKQEADNSYMVTVF